MKLPLSQISSVTLRKSNQYNGKSTFGIEQISMPCKTISKMKLTNSVHQTQQKQISTCLGNPKQIILKAQEKHVPTKTTSKCFSQPWFNAVCKKAVRKKKQRYRVHKRTKLDRDWSRFQEAAKNARKVCQKAYHEYVKNNIGEGKGNNKKFCTFIKSKRTDFVASHL